MDTYICIAESLRCSAETITILFVNRLYSNTKYKVSNIAFSHEKKKKTSSAVAPGSQPLPPSRAR